MRVKTKKSGKLKVQIDPEDTYSMDYTLGFIILPMLKQLRDNRNGYCIVDNEDIPEMLYDLDGEYKWDYILDEMIWTFSQVVKDEYFILVNDTNDRLRNGLRLFGKYYTNLWD